jgi:hypothetical protein
LVLLYRPNGTALWQPFNGYTISPLGSTTNWSGRFNISHVKQGQYAWAVPTGLVSVFNNSLNNTQIFLSGNDINIQTKQQKGDVFIYDSSGKLVWNGKFQNSLQVPAASWYSGVYTVQCKLQNEQLYTKKLVITR